MYNSHIYEDLSQIYLQNVGASGESIYDKEDRPLKFAFE